MFSDRAKGMDSFLQMFKEEILKNSDPNVASYNNIYHYLVRINNKQYGNLSYFNDFSNWVNSGPYRNLDVFVQDKWQYFCQFTNERGMARDHTHDYKIYLSVVPNHLDETVRRIFDFVDRENIKSHNKVGCENRDDQIVMRVTKKEDFDKIINFYNTDPIISKYRIAPNPFSFSYKGIAVASDGCVSYNSTVCHFLYAYFKNKIDSKKVNDINLNDFLNFVTNYYNAYFVGKRNIQKVVLDFNIDSTDKFLWYKNAAELFIKGCGVTFDINAYLRHVDIKSNPELIRREKSTFNEIRDQQILNPDLVDDGLRVPMKAPISEEKKKSTLDLLQSLITFMTKKHNSEFAYNNIIRFLRDGDPNFLSRETRVDCGNEDFRGTVNELMSQKAFDFNMFFHTSLNEEFCKSNGIRRNDWIQTTLDLLEEIIVTMNAKFGNEQVVLDTVLSFINTGNPNNITRENNLRFRATSTTFRGDMQELIRTGFNMERFASRCARRNIPEKNYDIQTNALRRAMQVTFDKYDVLFNANKSERSGSDVVFNALTMMAFRGNPEGFTRTLHARDGVIDSFKSCQEFIECLCVMTNTPKEEIDFNNIGQVCDLCRLCTDMYLKNGLDNHKGM